jgi:hypothetical protein
MVDASTLQVPLWAALTTGAGILTAGIGTIVWVFVNFERKIDAKERHDALEKRIAAQEAFTGRIIADVAYIRGRLETMKVEGSG